MKHVKKILAITTDLRYNIRYNRIYFQGKKGTQTMKAVITVTGKDVVGIIAKVSAACAENQANIIDISQSVLDEYFAMIMVVEIDGIAVEFTRFVEKMEALGRENGLVIHTMHEDVFNAMHHI